MTLTTFNPTKLGILDKKKQKSKSTEEKTEKVIYKRLWFQINKAEFDELTKNVYNNQDNNDFKITIKKKSYNLEKANKFWMKITTRKISKNEAKKMYDELIQEDIDTLTEQPNNDPRKYNILDTLNNVGSIFPGTYLHYKDVLKESV